MFQVGFKKVKGIVRKSVLKEYLKEINYKKLGIILKGGVKKFHNHLFGIIKSHNGISRLFSPKIA